MDTLDFDVETWDCSVGKSISTETLHFRLPFADIPPELQNFFPSGYQLYISRALDMDGDGKNEKAILMFNPNASDEPNCKGYCDPSYVIKVVKFNDVSKQWEEIYASDFTRKESSWQGFEVVDRDRDGKEELLFTFHFVRTVSVYLLNGLMVK